VDLNCCTDPPLVIRQRAMLYVGIVALICHPDKWQTTVSSVVQLKYCLQAFLVL
jgi:hypothetical protein